MRNNICTIMLAAVLLAASSVTASAQRQTPGRCSVDLSVRPGFNQVGGSVGWTRWGYDAALLLGVNVFSSNEPFTYHGYEKSGNAIVEKQGTYLDFDMSCTDILAGIGGLYRIVSTRSRSLILSAGGTVDFGVRTYGAFLKAPDYPTAVEGSEDWTIPDGLNKTAKDLTAGGTTFVYGLSPVVQLEFFPFKSVSLCLKGIPRVQFLNAYGEGRFYPDLSLGVNIYL